MTRRIADVGLYPPQGGMTAHDVEADDDGHQKDYDDNISY